MGWDDRDAFRKVEAHDEPELVGARWWREAAVHDRGGLDRRSALLALAGLSAAGAFGGLTGCSTGSSEPVDISSTALDAQRSYGWAFGSEGEPLDFGGAEGEPVEPAVLDALVDRLRPTNPAHEPYYGPVLFQAVSATPTTPAGSPQLSLRNLIRPVETEAMKEALGQGRGLSTLFEGAPPGRIVVVDLPGPQAVAFAAGLANRFDPVFWFDNWPHPRGLVPAHMTLAAVLHHLETFEELAEARGEEAPPVFVLDSDRLLAFDDSSDRFDNRYVADLPNAQQLQAMGVEQVLYVRPGGDDRELDDLNAGFVQYREAGIDVKLVPADAFVPAEEGAVLAAAEEGGDKAEGSGSYRTSRSYGSYFLYGGLVSHWFFWRHYGWGTPRYSAVAPSRYPTGTSYVPTRRPVQFGSTARPPGFGSVNVRKGGGIGAKPSLSPSQSKTHARASTYGRSTRSSSGSSGARGTTRGGSFGRTSGGRSGS